MDINQLKVLINENGGFEYVIGMRFKNGYKIAYSKQAMLEEDLVEVSGVGFVKFEHYDTNEHMLISYLLIGEIAQVFFLTNLEENVSLRETME